MLIYKAEQEAPGLEAKLLDPANSSLAFASQLLLPNGERLETVKAHVDSSVVATNLHQMDLFYLNTILTTVGWNGNDDVFTAAETWAARNTPEDKPFNVEHDPTKIIGHMTGSCVIDDSGTVIANNTPVDELPPKFHILAAAVIYRHLRSKNEELEEAAAEMISQIEAGEWFVSMEALFSDFDYAIMRANGSQEIVTRNQDTAWLTKHLRCYGGKGQYDDFRVGRAIKNITFSGKGLVRNPANKESIIMDSVSPFVGVFAESIQTEVSHEENEMSDATVRAERAEAQVTELRQTVAELKAQFETEKVEARFAELEGFNKELEEKLAASDEQINQIGVAKAAVEEAKAAVEAEKAELETKLAEVEAARDELQKQADESAAAALSASRVASLVDVGVEKADAEKLVEESFAGVSDEQFAAVVEMQKSLVEAKGNPFAKGDDDKDDKNKDDKKTKGGKGKNYASDEESDDTEAAEAAEAAVEDGEVEDDDTAALASEDDSADDEKSELESFLASNILPN